MGLLRAFWGEGAGRPGGLGEVRLGAGETAAAGSGTWMATLRRWGTCPSSLTSSRTELGRCAGSFASARASTWSSSSGSIAFRAAAEGTGLLTVASAISPALAPPKGMCPVIISKVMTPIA